MIYFAKFSTLLLKRHPLVPRLCHGTSCFKGSAWTTRQIAVRKNYVYSTFVLGNDVPERNRACTPIGVKASSDRWCAPQANPHHYPHFASKTFSIPCFSCSCSVRRTVLVLVIDRFANSITSTSTISLSTSTNSN